MQQSRRHRSRRRRRSRGSHHDESRAGRNVWIAVLIVAFLYAGFLVLSRYLAGDKPGNPGSPAKTATATTKSQAPAVKPAGSVSAESAIDGKAVEMIPTIKKAQQLIELGKKLMRVPQPATAELRFREALELVPDSITALSLLAEACVNQGKWADARPFLYQALSIAPESVPVRLSLARVSFELGENENALAIAEWIIDAEPYSEIAHEIAAEISTKLEQHEKAVTHWQKLVSLNSNNHVAENNLGIAHMKLGQTSQALKCFENVLRDEPGNSQAYYYMAQCFIQKKEPELAVDTLSRAIDRFGYSFVYAWSRGAEFAPLQELPSFKLLFSRDPSAAGGGNPPG